MYEFFRFVNCYHTIHFHDKYLAKNLVFNYDCSAFAPLESPKFAWHHHRTLDTYTIFSKITNTLDNLMFFKSNIFLYTMNHSNSKSCFRNPLDSSCMVKFSAHALPSFFHSRSRMQSNVLSLTNDGTVKLYSYYF